MSSTKPEVYTCYNDARGRLRRGHIGLQAKCTRTTFGRLVLEICVRTDTQTDTLIAILSTHSDAE